ncbi:reverse transcriptase [Phytophthora megakarya]|uniref:Reverse transcriptase n=1 Tax=Phytophthora megakarya TaxID=4795 RepID=A0A225VSF7_9STRA|nr:reverse transcriptase [Phytophthora megakarya]
MPDLMTCAGGYKNPPAIARRLECLPVVSRTGLDVKQVNPGFTRRKDGASTTSCASLGLGPRLFKEDGVGESSDIDVGVDLASSHEMEALREEYARWTHHTIMHSFVSRKSGKRSEGVEALFTGNPTETLSGKTKQERFDEHSCKILREHMDRLSDETPAEFPQDARLQHEIDLKYPDATVATVAGASKVRDFAPSCFYMIFIHSRAVDGEKKRTRK